MTSPTTHPSLLARLRDVADHDAWREFEGRYHDLIVRYARARGLQPADADDVCQIVLMSLVRRMRDFRYRPDLGRFRDYLGRTVHHAVGKRLARQNARAPRLLGEESRDVLRAAGAASGDGHDALWNREWMLHYFRRGMDAVRVTFAAKNVELFEKLLDGVSVADLARDYETTPQAIYKVKQRIRDKLRACVERMVRDEELPGAPDA